MNFEVLANILLLLLTEARGDVLSESKIIGGQSIEINQAPFMAILSLNNINACSAAIIGPKHFLTAGHCLKLIHLNDPKVKVGNTFSQNFTEVYNVTKWFVHPKFNPDIFDYDVGVFMIKETLKWSRSVAPIALAEENFTVPNNALVRVRGWGITNTKTHTIANQLQEVGLPVVPEQTCSKAYAKLHAYITHKNICAGGAAGKDSCQGDSGAPLTYMNKVVGIVSFGFECGKKGFPGVYTKVSSVRSWINTILF